MKGAVPAKIGPRVPEAETAPTPTVLVIRAAPHRPDFKLPKPTTRQGEAAAAARRDAELIGMLEVALHTPPIGLAQDVTILKASALFALFTTELLDTKLGSNETLRFKRSKARKEIIGRFTPALLESILAHLEANPPQQTEARRGWSNLLSNLQDHLDPKHQAVPESFDDVAGWTAWAQSYLQRRCATV